MVDNGNTYESSVGGILGGSDSTGHERVWPGMKTSELPKVDYRSVKPLQGNLKDLTEDNFEKLKRVLEKRGFDVPLFMWNGFILDGHQRVRVAQKIDLKPYEVPYIEIEAKDENEAKKRVLEISSQYGTITQEGYDQFTADLPEAELLETVNFDALGNFPDDPEVEEDEPPEVSKEPAKSELGEVYQLGRHRLMCGDATKKEDVDRLMDGKEADMVFTDPPYGIEYEGGMKHWDMLKNDDNLDFLPEAMQAMFDAQAEGAATYICFNDRAIPILMSALPQYEVNKIIVWVKNNSSFQISAHYKQKHEVIVYLKRKKEKLNWYGGSTEVTTWEIDRASANEYHSTEKPVSLCARAIKNSSRKDETVLDLFGGSGSTLIACEQLDRTCYMMELDERYVDVIRKRYWKLVNDDNEDGWEDNTKAITKQGKQEAATPPASST